MLDKLCRDPAHLERLLKSKSAEEKHLKIADRLLTNNLQDVEEWKESTRWLLRINRECGFQCETFALAVHILDDFLGIVKVNGKYLKCATLAAYYIAVKIMEEEEFVPTLSTFMMVTGNKFTANDIKRMEKIILEKTNWSCNHVTICSFLEIFFNLLCTKYFTTLFGSDSLAYSVYRNLANQSQLCTCSTNLLMFQSSTQALALLSCALEKITSRWFLYVEEMSSLAGMQISEVLECRELIKSIVLGHQKRRRTPKLKRYSKRSCMFAPRRSPLSPIVENPGENDNIRHMKGDFEFKLEKVVECTHSDEEVLQSEAIDEELEHFCRISLDEVPFPSPTKRRKITSCGIESPFNQSLSGMLVSPVKPISA